MCANWQRHEKLSQWVRSETPTISGQRGENVFAACRPCGNPAIVDIEEAGVLAIGVDGIGLDYPICGIVTGPKFGCLHWKALAQPAEMIANAQAAIAREGEKE
jgi:hypothetical protein